jgi:hypothetical protein
MRDRDLYAKLLGIETPWYVRDVDARLGQGEVEIFMATFAALAALACSDEPIVECVAVDPSLGDPSNKLWCEDDYYPTMTWNGELATASRTVCLPPTRDQQCQACPAQEVRDAVGDALRASLEEYVPGCELQHWELGCMRTIENAKKIVGDQDPNFCCFQVAIWGPGCGF